MVIDLTRRPLMVFPEVCEKAIVVRTFQTRDADGRLSVKREPHPGDRRGKSHMTFLEPGASLKRGEVTCLETRLDLYEAKHAYDAANVAQVRWGRYELEKPKIDLAADPYEVATAARDAVTNMIITWRIGIYIQKAKDLWVTTVRDMSGDKLVDLCSVGMRDLDMIPRLKDDLPLLRLVKKTAGKPQNAWEHLLEDD